MLHGERVSAREQDILQVLDIVARQVNRAFELATTGDSATASAIVREAAALARRCRRAYERVLAQLAEGNFGPADVRFLAALLHAIRAANDVGEECLSLAELARAADDPLGSGRLPQLVNQMGRLACRQVWLARMAFTRRDTAAAEEVARSRLETGYRAEQLLSWAIAARDGQSESVRWALTVAASFERIGDGAVDIAEHTVSLVTGLFCEIADAPRVST